MIYFVREARIVAEWTPKHLLLLNGGPPERNGSTVHNYPYGELLICDRSIQSGSFSESEIPLTERGRSLMKVPDQLCTRGNENRKLCYE